MKEIKLSQGKVALVDDEDYEYLNQWKWYAHKNGNTYYVNRDVRHGRYREKISMHRFIMNTPKKLQVDHIDHNGLNNQKNNLRNCTRSQNQRNKIASLKSSKYLGVSKRDNSYKAIITDNGKKYYLGTFHSEIEAAASYNEAAKKYHKEFANLNKI